MEQGKRYTVYSIRHGKQGNIWLKVGAAFVNRDASLNVYLDALPLDGQLQIRETVDRKSETSPAHTEALTPRMEVQ